MTAPFDRHRLAREWVTDHFPAVTAIERAGLILAYGHGLDDGYTMAATVLQITAADEAAAKEALTCDSYSSS